jgi:hypothetical protein
MAEYAERSQLRDELIKQFEDKYKTEVVKTLGSEGFKYNYRGTMCEIDKHLKSRLDHDLKAIVNAWDCVFVVTGMEGSGKSMGAGMTLATYFSWIFNSDFTVDNVVFTPKQFEERVDKAKKYEVIFWDEFIFGGSADATMSKMQKSLKKTFTVIRHKRLFIVLLMPYFHMMNKYWALARSRALINVISPDGIRRGYGRFYGYQKKRFAYIHGKKNMDIMPFKYDFEVKFLNFGDTNVVGKPPIDLEAYELKKTLSRKEADEDEEENNKSKQAQKYKERIAKLSKYFYENKLATVSEMAKIMGYDQSDLSKVIKSIGEN